jgi:hypothetical protein
MRLRLREGEKLQIKGRTVTVTPTAVACLPRMREHLIEVAKAGQTTTYGELKAHAGLPYAPNGLGRPLDLLSEDCRRRDEPSLASLVVSAATGEVGSDFGGDPVAERVAVYALWC